MRISNKRKGILKNIDIINTVDQLLPEESRVKLFDKAGGGSDAGGPPVSQVSDSDNRSAPGIAGPRGASSGLGLTPWNAGYPTGST